MVLNTRFIPPFHLSFILLFQSEVRIQSYGSIVGNIQLMKNEEESWILKHSNRVSNSRNRKVHEYIVTSQPTSTFV